MVLPCPVADSVCSVNQNFYEQGNYESGAQEADFYCPCLESFSISALFLLPPSLPPSLPG